MDQLSTKVPETEIFHRTWGTVEKTFTQRMFCLQPEMSAAEFLQAQAANAPPDPNDAANVGRFWSVFFAPDERG
jgi:hypothetical protein